ncbi:MAG: hypothetical protein HC827_03820 [Cyanobacteria bacterium RM1_2_2]|nr:hypothetical protein [Cyanobacteria bacterium RM1_2_2]
MSFTHVMNGTPYRELLAQQGGGFTEPEVRDLLAAVLPQLMHLHQQGTAHGGVSPDTLVHDSISQHTHLIPAQPLTDSSYLAPECLQTGQATATGDVYGLGVTLLTLLTGQSPLVLQPSPGIWNWRAYCSVSHPLAALIDKTIAFHSQLRFADAMQVFQALQTLSEPYHSSAPTADPPTQTTPYTTPTSSATVPVAPIAASSTANLTAHRRFPWPWVAMGAASLLLLSLVSLAAARFLNPSREPVSPSPTDSASELSPLPDAQLPDADAIADPSDSPNLDTDNPLRKSLFPK